MLVVSVLRLVSEIVVLVIYCLAVREVCICSEQKYQTSELEDHSLLFDLVERMLAYDPTERLTLAQALRHPFFSKLTADQRRPPALLSRNKSYSISR